jgi:hypothetical protein
MFAGIDACPSQLTRQPKRLVPRKTLHDSINVERQLVRPAPSGEVLEVFHGKTLILVLANS